MKTATAAALVLIGAAAWMAWRKTPAPADSAASDEWTADTLEGFTQTADDVLTEVSETFINLMPVSWTLNMWTPEKVPVTYRAAIAAAETANGLPSGLLARLLYQESRYRPEIINGTVKSRAGAVGIAQIIPRWHPGVNPLDPLASIDYAAAYLAKLYRQFGAWPLALAAYNWGPGNVAKNGLTGAPTETRNYWSQILADLGLSEDTRNA